MVSNGENKMSNIEHECENTIRNARVNGNERLDITSNKRNVGLLHFSMMIILNPCFHNYVRRLPYQTLPFNDWFYK